MMDKDYLTGELRRRPKARLTKEKKLNPNDRVPDSGSRTMIYKLQRHRMELEELNKKLRLEIQQMEASLNHYKTIFNVSPMGYLTLDRNGKILEINPAGACLLGWERESLLQKAFSRHVAEESRDDYQRLHQLVSKVGRRETIRLKLRNRCGSSFHASVEYREVKDGKKNVRRLMVIKDDTQQVASETRLEETNKALKTILKYREEDRKKMNLNILANIWKLVMPSLNKLKQTGLSENQDLYLRLIEIHIEQVISPFLQHTAVYSLNLTPREIEVAGLVKEGRKTKEIADALHTSIRSVEFHKDKIRKKIGLINRKISLQSYLMSINKMNN